MHLVGLDRAQRSTRRKLVDEAFTNPDDLVRGGARSATHRRRRDRSDASARNSNRGRRCSSLNPAFAFTSTSTSPTPAAYASQPQGVTHGELANCSGTSSRSTKIEVEFHDEADEDDRDTDSVSLKIARLNEEGSLKAFTNLDATLINARACG